MLTKKAAREKIELLINEPDPDWENKPKLVVVDEYTIEKEWGWVFFYNSSEYLKSQSLEDALVGNAPYLVNKNTGEIVETGTAYDIEYYLKEYEANL